MTMRRKFYSLSVLACCLALLGCNKAPTIVTLTRSDGTSTAFHVEIADDPKEQEHGLMGRQDLAADHGMIFIFPKEHNATFWMKNTPLFLDMIFIDDKGRIVHIHPLAKPYDETLITTPVPARAVLEIKGGEAKRQHLMLGDQITVLW